MSYQLVCVGDTTLDTFLKVHDAAVHCDLKTKSCELCFKYGEKIAVDELRQNPGGNSANVAVGTATLGVKTALYAIIGDDDVGQKVKRMIAEREVSTKYLSINKGRETNYSTIISFKGERTILEMKYPAHLSFTKFPKTQWVYLSSIKQDPKTVYEPLVHLKKKHGFRIAFNPGMFQLTHKSKDIINFLRFVDVLIVNREEGQLLCEKITNYKLQITNKLQNSKFKTTNKKEIRRLAQDDRVISYSLSTIHSVTKGLIFITDGKQGAYGYDGSQMIHCAKFPASVVADRTGAGDAFSSGIMAGLIQSAPFPEVIRWGMANSAAVLREIGPQNGLLDSQTMKKTLKYCSIRTKSLSN